MLENSLRRRQNHSLAGPKGIGSKISKSCVLAATALRFIFDGRLVLTQGRIAPEMLRMRPSHCEFRSVTQAEKYGGQQPSIWRCVPSI